MVKVYIPVLPKSPLKYLQIFRLCVDTPLLLYFLERVFLKLKKGKHSKDANFAVKNICVLNELQFHIFMQCKLVM